MLHFVISGQKKHHLVKTVDRAFAIALYSHYKFQKGGGRHYSSAICYFTYLKNLFTSITPTATRDAVSIITAITSGVDELFFS